AAITDGLNIISVKTVDQAIPIVFDLKTSPEQLKVKQTEVRKKITSAVRKTRKAKVTQKQRPKVSNRRKA
ncbi:MAG TPA: hypothetical protein VFX22_01270, partial [Candidatus Kapabacteria bacterium]|nr:hypothetical protein [Candidatus Kapabacteria bacterium]